MKLKKRRCRTKPGKLYGYQRGFFGCVSRWGRGGVGGVQVFSKTVAGSKPDLANVKEATSETPSAVDEVRRAFSTVMTELESLVS